MTRHLEPRDVPRDGIMPGVGTFCYPLRRGRVLTAGSECFSCGGALSAHAKDGACPEREGEDVA